MPPRQLSSSASFGAQGQDAGDADEAGERVERRGPPPPRRPAVPVTEKGMGLCATRRRKRCTTKTGDPVLAQMLLRHKDLKTTRGYLHPSLDRLEAALESMDRGSSALRPLGLQANAR